MELKSFNQIKKLSENKDKKVVAVAAGDDLHTLQAIKEAHINGAIDFYITGIKEDIIKISKEIGLNISDDKIIDTLDNKQAAFEAVKLIREKKANFLMKGKLQTSELLKEVVNKQTGISLGKTISHVSLLEIPTYHKLLCLTDCAMIPYPDINMKKDIVINAVSFLNNLGYQTPKVGVIAAIEYLNPKMKETVDADNLANMAKNGELGNCILEGPISYDIVMRKDIAEHKGYKSAVSGEADILVMPDLVCGNVLSKALTNSAGAKMVGCIVGAAVPIVLTSRGATSEEKFMSILLASLGA